MTNNKCSENLQSTSTIVAEYGGTFRGVQFDAKLQAIEVFHLQSLSMSSSHCRAASLLLDNGCLGEAVAVLRAVQELVFDIYWVLKPSEKTEQLDRVYQLEADPYSHWSREIKLIQKTMFSELANSLQKTLDEAICDYPYLLDEGSKDFKRAPSFADRIGEDLRPKFYHVYSFASLFTHPTPMIKDLYLKSDDVPSASRDRYAESMSQFTAYTLLFVQMMLLLAESAIGEFAPMGRDKRTELRVHIDGLVRDANKGYFHSSQPTAPEIARPPNSART